MSFSFCTSSIILLAIYSSTWSWSPSSGLLRFAWFTFSICWIIYSYKNSFRSTNWSLYCLNTSISCSSFSTSASLILVYDSRSSSTVHSYSFFFSSRLSLFESSYSCALVPKKGNSCVDAFWNSPWDTTLCKLFIYCSSLTAHLSLFYLSNCWIVRSRRCSSLCKLLIDSWHFCSYSWICSIASLKACC